jgi:single-strand DNA-binding protein
MNVWIGEGRLVRDPELKVVGGGTEICNITVAIDRGRKDKDGNKQTDFVDCTAWGKTAAFVQKYFKKGDGIVVEGRFESDTYDAKDGTKRTKWGVTVDNIEFPQGGKGKSEQTNSDVANFQNIDPSDIPF